MNAQLVLFAGVALATLGMALIVLAVVAPGLFYPGVYLIDAGALGIAAGGIMHLLAKPETV